MVFWFIVFVSPLPTYFFPSFSLSLLLANPNLPLSSLFLFLFPSPLFLLLLPSTLAFPLHLSFPFSHLSYPHPQAASHRLTLPPLSILIAASCRRLVQPRGRFLFAHTSLSLALFQPSIASFYGPLRPHIPVTDGSRRTPLLELPRFEENNHGSRRTPLLEPLLEPPQFEENCHGSSKILN